MPTIAGKSPRRLSDAATGRDNHFNLIRMIAACGVLVSHAFPIALGRGAAEPFERALDGIALGTVSVYVFFAISGFFIAESFARSGTFERFVRARVLRLFPALFVVLAITILVGAALTTTPSAAYWSAAPDYVARNMTLYFLRWDLPGVFEANPYGTPINGSLWTLNYEVTCYGGVAVLGLLGILRRPALAAVALAACLLAYIWLQEGGDVPPKLRLLADLGLPFAFGVAAHVWRDRIVLDGRIALALAAVALAARLAPDAVPGSAAVFRALFALALAYGVLWLGHVRAPRLLAYNRLGDYSYGVYIYAFPAQQLAAHWGFVDPLSNMAAAAAMTLPAAVLSWRLVEKPALRLKSVAFTWPLRSRS